MKRGLAEEDSGEALLERVHTSHATLVARLYAAHKERGGGREDFISLFEEAGYSLPPSTLTRWSRGVEEEGEALSGTGKRGRKSKLSDEEKRLLAGWVYDRQFSNLKTKLSDIVAFCASFLDTEASEAAASRWMAELGFVSRKMQTKSGGYLIDADSCIDMAYSWLAKHHNDLDPSRTWSIDCVFTGHRTDTHKSFVVSGGPPANYSGAISSFTALGITCVCGDGRYYPMVLYTRNPAFNRNVNPTARRTAIWDRIDKIFQKYAVDPSRIVFVAQEDAGKSKSIVPATAARVEDFFNYYEIEEDAIILSDNGDEFRGLEQLGFARHIPYPGPVHQYLSPNDNRLHGAAKQRWRASGVDFKDDPEALISFLSFMDESQSGVVGWFERNLQITSFSLSREKVADLIRGGNEDKFKYYQECRREYRFAAGLDPRGDYTDRLPDELDGKYWDYK